MPALTGPSDLNGRAVPRAEELLDVSKNVMNKIGNCRSVHVSYGLNSRVLFLFTMYEFPALAMLSAPSTFRGRTNEVDWLALFRVS